MKQRAMYTVRGGENIGLCVRCSGGWVRVGHAAIFCLAQCALRRSMLCVRVRVGNYLDLSTVNTGTLHV